MQIFMYKVLAALALAVLLFVAYMADATGDLTHARNLVFAWMLLTPLTLLLHSYWLDRSTPVYDCGPDGTMRPVTRA